MVLRRTEGRTRSVQAGVGVTGTETYTHREVDELSGAMLYIGGIHGALGHLLDITAAPADLRLIEFTNHAPSGIVDELLPATVAVIDAVIDRLKAMRGAVESALDTNEELKAYESGDDGIREAFDSLMGELYPEAKNDGLT